MLISVPVIGNDIFTLNYCLMIVIILLSMYLDCLYIIYF